MAKSTVKGTKIKLDRSDIIIRTIGYVVVTLYAVACVLPFLIIIGTSFTAEEVIRTEGAQLFPKQFTTKAYEMVLQGGAIWKSYGLPITMTLTGTLVGLGIISMTGYALQRKDFPFRNAISFYIYFTTLFSAGLAPYYPESMVLGEDQILGQLKDAADLSRTLGHSGKELNYIVREAVSCAKRIKTEYKVSEKPVSVCYVGIQELDRVCGISGKHALVIGSGKPAALAIRNLAEYGADVTVCSRTYQHAKALLKEFPDIQVIAYDKKTEALKSSDIVVSATSSPHLVIRASELSDGKKMTLLDLAAPRDIEKSAGSLDGVTLIDLDRIGGIVKSNQNERAHLLKESQCVIDEYIAETKKWLTSSRMDTTIQSLGKKCDEIVQDSYDYLNRKIDLSDHDRVILKKILKSSLHRLLKEPIEELKNVEENEQQQYKDMVERLFGL